MKKYKSIGSHIATEQSCSTGLPLCGSVVFDMEIQKPYKIISSGSQGNCVLIFDTILVDVGVPFSSLGDFWKKIQLITWGHQHHDHFNENTIKKLISLRPGLRVAVCEHEVERAKLCGARNIDIIEHGKWYNYGSFQLATFKTYHDVPSNGYRIKNEKYKIFFATDTAHLLGISAKNYTHYLIEFNYDEETVYDIIREKEKFGEYAHQKGAINSHLSRQQAQDFIFNNASGEYEVVRLHESKSL